MGKIQACFVFFVTMCLTAVFATGVLLAQVSRSIPTVSPSPMATAEPEVLPTPRTDITQKTEEAVGPLEELLNEQVLGPVWPTNPVKYAIRGALSAGVPANTIALLLLLPFVSAVIAATRHLIGLRGFGIFLPAALSVTFVAIGPVLGIILFLAIIFISTLFRIVTRKLKLKLQYLPRMAMLLWFVVAGVLGVLFLAPVIKQPDLANVSIFPVLILVLLSEDFSRVQIGKSVKTAVNLTSETLILALLSFLFLTFKSLQKYALLNPEIFLSLVLFFDFIVGKYVGLRFMEFWRFRKLISSS